MDDAARRAAPPRRPAGSTGQPSWWRSPRAWWASRTLVQRVEVYTQQALYWLGAVAPLLLLVLLPGAVPGWLLTAVVALSVAQGMAAFVVLRAGLATHGSWTARALRARRGVPVLVTTTAGLLGLAALAPGADLLADSPRHAVVAYTVLLSPAAVCVAYRRSGWLVPVAAGAAVTLSAATAAEPGTALLVGAFTTAASAFLVVTLRLSLWLLDVVRQLADAQGDRARLAVAEERLRFARDLHDVVGRDLSAIALKSEVVARLAERGRPEAVAEALAVRELAQSSLAEVRAVVRGHRRADLATELAGARALLSSTGAACELRVDDDTTAALSAAAQEALAWAVREAVTNVVRHAHARLCSVSLAVVDGAAVLVVRNDGAQDGGGGPGQGALSPGSGLTGLRERLEARGGSLAVRHDGPRVELVATVPAELDRRSAPLPLLAEAAL